MSVSAGKAVFLSYASQDAEAAKRICEALRAAGAEVWFDQSELRGGDAWDSKIRQQIKECALFLPVISANTQARPEGYFRVEWRLADRRTEAMGKSKAFLVPITIDDTRDSGADVPDSFIAVQWTRLPGGETTPAFCQRVMALLSGDVGRGPPTPPPARLAHVSAGSGDPALQPSKAGRRVPAAAWAAGALLLVVAAGAGWWLKRPASATTPADAARQSEVQKLLTRIWDLYEKQDDAIRDDWTLAEDLGAQAVKLEPTNADAWAAYSAVTLCAWVFNYDQTPARFADALSRAQRAIGLAPESFEARFALANCYRQQATMRTDAERTFRVLVSERPGDRRALRMLAATLRQGGQYDEALALLNRAARLPGGDPVAVWSKVSVLWHAGRWAEAEAAVDESLAIRRGPSALLRKVYLLLYLHGDLAQAAAVFETVPAAYLLKGDGIYLSFLLGWWRRDAAQCFRALSLATGDMIQGSNYLPGPGGGVPKGLLAGKAHTLAGNAAAAEKSWRDTLAFIEQQSLQRADEPSWIYWKAVIQSMLGDTADATRSLGLFEQLQGTRSLLFFVGTVRVVDTAALLGRLGQEAKAIATLASAHSGTAAPLMRVWIQNHLRHDPDFDPLRPNAQFQALLAEPKNESSALGGVAAGEKSIAVLAFENRSNEKDGDVFSDGVSEELLNVLSRVKGLRVPARTSAFSFKGKGATAQEIGQKLSVAYLVEGTVRKSGDRVRITAKLINAADGLTLWISDALERESKDVWAVQDEIAGLIAEKLQLQLGAAPRAAKPVNPAAHQLLLEGRLFWLRRTFEDFNRADAAFGSALKLDPEFAQAQAGLADVAVMRATYRMLDGETDVADDIARARVAAQRALTLDGSLVEPHAALAYALMLEGKFAASEVEYQKALTLNPNYSTAYVWRGVLKFCEGRLDAAIDEFRKAVDLDPLWPINLHMLSEALTHAGRFDEALAVNARGSAIRAVNWPPERGVLAMAAWRQGRRDDAIGAARQVRQLWPQPPRWFADVDAIWILGQAGLRDDANAHALQLLKELPAANSHRGLILAALGRFDEALPHLERSGVMTRRNLFWDPVFDRFRDDPRFRQLMVKLGCAAEYQTARETLQRTQAKP